MTEQQPTSDERLLAALSHFLGLVVALVIWATQKDKSRYVRFHAVQAMAFDALIMVFVFLLVGCMVAFTFAAVFLSGAAAFATAPEAANGELDGAWLGLFMLPAIIPFFVLLCVVPFAIGTLIARLIAAVQTYQGIDFRYPWLGARVERFLEGG